MNVATKRACRTCPAILENYSGAGETWDQCIRCSERSKAVRAAVASEPLPVLRVSKPKKRTCKTDGHHACEHYAALGGFLIEWCDDMAMCPVCSAALPDGAADDAPIPHKAGCALALLIEPATRTDAAGHGERSEG